MNRMLALLLLLISVSARATDSQILVGSDPETTLARVEFRIASYVSGKEKFHAGIAGMPPRLKAMACSAYPTKTSAETIALINSEIASLEEEKTHSTLSPAQKERLEAQKALAAKLSPTAECATDQSKK